MDFYSALFPFFKRIPPESAHHLNLRAMATLGKFPSLVKAMRERAFHNSNRAVYAFGLSFPNPVGLAAGYDKDGTAWRGLAALGFGHIEVGTVTPRPQSGNPKPRIFRLGEDHALINRMGFPGKGADFVARQLLGPRPPGLILGVNLGKNKDTPNEEASNDYVSLLHTFAPLADYLVINVSSPNTQGLRRLQARDALTDLLKVMLEERDKITTTLNRPVPLLIKIAPDLSHSELEDTVGTIVDAGLDGIIATNTTLSRAGLKDPQKSEGGGMSGKALTESSTEILRRVSKLTGGRLPLIGVGGIMTADDALRKLDAGASLVQLYTGLIYRGPNLIVDTLKKTAIYPN